MGRVPLGLVVEQVAVHCDAATALRERIRGTSTSVVSKRRWRRSVNSVSLADLVQRRSAARWTGCSARAFAEAVVAKLEWRCKQQSFVADVLGTQAEVKAQYDRAVAANAQCLRGMEVQACKEYAKLADELGLTPDEVRSAGKPDSLPANVSSNERQSRVA